MFIVTATNFIKWRHVNLLKKYIYLLPHHYGSLDSCRTTVLLFSLSGLQLVNELDSISKEERQKIADWLYKLQITSEHGKYVYLE